LFLGIRDGYIALWKYGDPTPLQVFPCRVEMLPLADQKALAQGIHISSEQELSQLLEDYLS
jgi:hypothetical protein